MFGNNIGLVILLSLLFLSFLGVGEGCVCVVWLSAWTDERGCECTKFVSVFVCEGAVVYAILYSHAMIIKENCLSVRQLVLGL